MWYTLLDRLENLKGILINQRNICHFLRSENSLLEINRNDRVYQGLSVAFDLSLEEIWLSYLVGASPVASTERASNRSTCSAKRIEWKSYKRSICGANLFGFVQYGCCDLSAPNCTWRWNVLRAFGQSLGLARTPSVQHLRSNWSNGFGQLRSFKSTHTPVTIGKPLPNYNCLIIDLEKIDTGPKLLKRGEIGELCKWSLGKCGSLNSSILYRSGDLARINQDGFLQLHGTHWWSG